MKKEHSFIKRICPSKTILRIDGKIDLLGNPLNYSVEKFLMQRLFISVFLFFCILILFRNFFIIAFLTAMFAYFVLEFLVFDLPIQKRGKKLEKEAIFFFEVLSLTLESGKSLSNAIALTTSNIDSELSSEFQKALREMKLGKSFTESISNMKQRIPSDSINNTLLNIVQSSIFGNDITESLNNQLDYLRDKRILEVKEKISKLPIKISVISVLFFIPIMLLVILSPILLELLLG